VKKKILIALAVLVVILVVAVVVITMDAAPPDDSDLLPRREEIADERNAYPVLQEACEKLYWPTGATALEAWLDTDAWDDNYMRELLERNEEALQLIDQALQRPELQVPEVTAFGYDIEYLGAWRAVARLLRIAAHAHARNGNYRAAADAALQDVRLGTMVQHGDGALIHYLVGLAIEQVGLAAVRQTLTRGGAPADVLQHAADMIADLPSPVPAMKSTIKTEYVLINDGMDEQVTGPMRLFAFKPNKTRRLFASQLRLIMEWADGPPRHRQPVRNFYPPELRRSTVRLFLSGNAAGYMLFSTLINGMTRAADETLNLEFNRSASRIVLALNRYEQDHGELPEKLDALVPDYLAELPADPFTGEPPVYLPDEGILYGVDDDTNDDGGYEEADDVYQIHYTPPGEPDRQPATDAPDRR
jgi:hypothetical protein